MEAPNWYYSRGWGERVGPVTQDVLCAMFEQRQLSPDTMVWGDLFKRWVPARSIEGFRDACGIRGVPGVAGILGYDNGADAWALGGWLIIPAIGKVLYPPIYMLAALAIAMAGDRLESRGVIPSAVPMQVVAIVYLVLGVYELGAAVLFFGRRRAAVPAMIGGWGLSLAFTLLTFLMGPRGRVSEGAAIVWLAHCVFSAGWSVGWIWYVMVSERVKSTFVR